MGELLQNQFRVGFTRLERVIRERMTIQDLDVVTPQSLINIRPVTAAIKEFFGSSPLSQFMDQNNPLAELTHKRRLSALGPGGLSRERASFDVRDVHYTHYGRMCPIETPEGPNIGLINYLASYAKINEYGFIEAPFRKVDKATGKVTDTVEYMTADVEDDYYRRAGRTSRWTKRAASSNARVICRHRDEIISVERELIDYIDVSPEHDDLRRDGVHPVPRKRRREPRADGRKHAASGRAADGHRGADRRHRHRAQVRRRLRGLYHWPRAPASSPAFPPMTVSVSYDDGNTADYTLTKFARSNQGTCINQRPIVTVGERVEAGQVIADGPACSQGEIALGKNVLIGFMTWEGYNYEDAILLNERLVREDVFTSIHIEEYETESRDTKLGTEEITRDIPNVGEDTLKDLDENGIIRIGAEVTSGDYPGRQGHPEGRDRADRRRAPAARHLRRKGPRGPRLLSEGPARREPASSSTSRSSPVKTATSWHPASTRSSASISPRRERSPSAIRWPAATATRASFPASCRRRICPSCPTARPLDIVLNPLGVPSRMNIGQVLEVHLGYAAHALGWKVATPIFNGANEKEIRELLKQGGVCRGRQDRSV